MSDFPDVDFDAWRERVEQELDGASLDSLTVESPEGVVIAPLYARADADGSGFPGLPPFVRGSGLTTGRPSWLRWQRVEEPGLAAAIAAIEADRAGDVDGLWLRLDRGARLGRPPVADGSTGGDGIIALDGGDLERLVEAAGDGKLALRLDAGGNALPVSAALFAALESLGRDRGALRIHLGMDPIGSLAADGALPAPAPRLGRECALLAARSARHLRGVRALAVNTGPYARAGADSAQQLAFAMSTAVQYLRWLEEEGVEPEEAAGQIEFLFETDRHFLLEAAKLRAARLLWARVQHACGTEPVAPWIHASTGWRTLTRLDPWTNMLRGTVQTAAAVVGGADSITTTPFDRPLGVPEDVGLRLARNTQAILEAECRLGEPVDPAGGSYAVEALTEQLAASAWERFQAIEASGGVLECLRSGVIHDGVAESARRRAERLRSDDGGLIGVTRYRDAGSSSLTRETPDVVAASAAAIERLAARRGQHDPPDLAPLEACAYDEEADASRLGDALMAAARAGATIHELSVALRPGAAPVEIAPLAVSRDEDLVPEPTGAGEEE